ITPQEDIDFLEFISECEKPCKLIFVGVNGTGKTTTIAKVARYLMRNNLSVVLAAGDTFRAGAIEQISRHAQNLGVNTIKHQKGADAAAVIYDAIEHARSKGIDVVLADTAGRMQTNINLMDELRKITRVNKPHLSIFVGDALTGNDAVDQAKKFNDAIGVDAIILTKMDADAKGGSALSIVNETRRPIIFMGTGQNLEDLEEFDREWFVAEIIGGS
ncbi:MAG: signal recognition particle-docking protein FtsY, partial [Candidatus Altiarchaeales archaeon]|nr:signal recognition particle-docking protein FtsY [Candidatus Altiarchaeales archaeon]